MKKILLAFTLLIVVLNSRAQQSLTLYTMDVIGQSTQVNPSLMPGNKMYIGIPLLSSTTFQFTNSGFTWRDIHKVRADDSVTIDIDNALSKLKAKNYMSLSFRINILEAGFLVKNNYFTFNVSERANMNFVFPKELFELILKGNGQFVGQEVDLKRAAFDVTHYREYAIGMARDISPKVTVGGRFKYLYGMENYSSADNDFSFYTAPDDYQLELNSNYVINTSSSANGSSNGYLFGYKNTGFAADMSVTYKMNERWKMNASVNDLGYIRWKTNVKNLVTTQGNYTFDGIDLNKFMGDSSSGFESLGDSLGGDFTPSTNSDSYKTNLPTQIYLNAAYTLDQKTTASALLHALMFRNTVQPTFTMAINRKITNHLSACVNWSMINHYFNNVGAGLAVNAGAFQFYMISDNLIGTINPLSHHTTQLQFGFNLIYGRGIKKKYDTDYGVKDKATKTDTSTTTTTPEKNEEQEQEIQTGQPEKK